MSAIPKLQYFLRTCPHMVLTLNAVFFLHVLPCFQNTAHVPSCAGTARFLQGISQGCRGSIREGWHHSCNGNWGQKWLGWPSKYFCSGWQNWYNAKFPTKLGWLVNFFVAEGWLNGDPFGLLWGLLTPGPHWRVFWGKKHVDGFWWKLSLDWISLWLKNHFNEMNRVLSTIRWWKFKYIIFTYFYPNVWGIYPIWRASFAKVFQPPTIFLKVGSLGIRES